MNNCLPSLPSLPEEISLDMKAIDKAILEQGRKLCMEIAMIEFRKEMEGITRCLEENQRNISK